MRGGIRNILQTHSEVFRFFLGVFRVLGVFRDVPGFSGVPCSGVLGNTTCQAQGIMGCLVDLQSFSSISRYSGRFVDCMIDSVEPIFDFRNCFKRAARF